MGLGSDYPSPEMGSPWMELVAHPLRPWLLPTRELEALQLGARLLLPDPELWVLTHHRATKC